MNPFSSENCYFCTLKNLYTFPEYVVKPFSPFGPKQRNPKVSSSFTDNFLIDLVTMRKETCNLGGSVLFCNTILTNIQTERENGMFPSLKNDAFIVYCNAAALPMYWLFIYCSSTQHTAAQVKISLTLLQYRTVVVCAEMAIQPLQLDATRLQWVTMTIVLVINIWLQGSFVLDVTYVKILQVLFGCV